MMESCLGTVKPSPAATPHMTAPAKKLPPPTPLTNKARAPRPPLGQGLQGLQGPRRVSDSLTMALRRGKAKAPSPPAEKEDEEEETTPKECSNGGHRYQNAQFGYTGETVKVRPYALAIHSFVPQFDNELALSDGDVVYLTRHVEHDHHHHHYKLTRHVEHDHHHHQAR